MNDRASFRVACLRAGEYCYVDRYIVSLLVG